MPSGLVLLGAGVRGVLSGQFCLNSVEGGSVGFYNTQMPVLMKPYSDYPLRCERQLWADSTKAQTFKISH